MKEILIPLNFTPNPVVYDTKQSFSTADASSAVLAFSTTEPLSGVVASLTIKNISQNANLTTVLIDRIEVTTSPFRYAFFKPLASGDYYGEIILKRNLEAIGSAQFTFGVNSSLAAEVLPHLIQAYSLDDLVEQVEAEINNLKAAYNLNVESAEDRISAKETLITGKESIRALNETQRKANEFTRIAQESARVSAEGDRQETFDTLVDTGVIEQVVVQEVAEKYIEVESTYAPRLLSAEQQLEQTNIIADTAAQKADAMASGSPKGVYATLALLQDAYPTGTTGAYLIGADGNWYYWSGSAWVSGGVYQAVELADGSVTFDKTEFFETYYDNLLDKTTITKAYLSAAGVPIAYASANLSDFIPIEYGKTYKLPLNSYQLIGTWSGHLYDANKADLGKYSATNYDFTNTNVNAKYIRIVWNKATLTDMDSMFVEGTVYPNVYVPHEVKLRITSPLLQEKIDAIADGTVTPEKTSFFNVEHTNLVDKSAISLNTYIQDTGIVKSDVNADTSDFIPVDNGKTYATPPTMIKETLEVWTSFAYDSNKNPLNRVAPTDKKLIIEPGGGVKEIAKLTITSAATTNGDITITLAGVSTSIPILTTDTTVDIATKIRATSFPGCTTGGDGLVVYFIFDTVGDKGTHVFSAGTTGMIGTMRRAPGVSAALKYVRIVWFKSTGTVADTNAMMVEGAEYPVEYIPYSATELGFTNETDKSLFARKMSSYIKTDNELYGMTWGVLGDSITADANAYHKWVGEALGLNVINYGIGETAIAYNPARSNPMSERYVNMSDDCDIVTVLGGTNDGSATIGTMADRTNTTFYGALHVLYAGLKEKYSGKRIGIMLMTPRDGVVGVPGTHFSQRIAAEIEVAHYYGIAVLDLFNESGIAIMIPNQRTLYMPDGLHPSIAGHKLLARPIAHFLKRL